MKVEYTKDADSQLAFLMEQNQELAIEILQWTKKLGADPWLNRYDKNGNTTTKPVESLRTFGYDVRRLRSDDFGPYRVFYFVNEEEDIVRVCEIVSKVGRGDDIYDDHNLPHIQRLMAEYEKHFGKPKRRRK